MHAERAHLNGIDLHYRIGGEGPTLLLLHGFTGVGEWWDPLLDLFSEKFTVIVPDLPGHGRSTGHSGPYSYPQVSQDLFALLDQLGRERFRAIGFSAGGEILLHMATQQPTRIPAMSLIGAIHRIPESIQTVLKDFPALEDNPPGLQSYWRKHHPGGDQQIRALLSALRTLGESKVNMDFSAEELSRIEARTLLILGDRDEFVPLDIAVEMYQAIPDAAFWVIPSQGHLALWPDWGGSRHAYRIFPSVVTRFLQRKNGPSHP